MIKRSNKLVAFMVSVTSIVSITPAAASIRLEAKDGTITNAAVFKDGKYIYSGFKDDNDTGVYYNDGSKENFLEDISEFADNSKDGFDYIWALDDDNNEYKVSLADGSFSDDRDRADIEDDVKRSLKSTIKRTDRYGRETKINSFERVQDAIYSDGLTWYSYTADGNPKKYKDVTVSSDEGDNEGETNKIKSKITITINALYSDITIGGKNFSPAWGSNLAESLADSIKNTLFDGYTVMSVTADSIDQNSGSVIVVLGSEDEISELPEGFLKFGGNVPSWEITSSIEDVKNEDKDDFKTKLKIVVNALYGDVTIAGKTFSPAWGSNLAESLAGVVKNTAFDGYEVVSVDFNSIDQNSGSVTIVLGSKEEKDSLPEGFIKFNGEIPDWEISMEIVEGDFSKSEENVEATEINDDLNISEEIEDDKLGEAIDNIKNDINNDLIINEEEDKNSQESNETLDNNENEETTKEVEDSENNLLLDENNIAVDESTSNVEKGTESVSLNNNEVVIAQYVNESVMSKDDAEEVSAPEYYGYVNNEGKYIDCSHIANIKLFNGKKVVKIEEFNSVVTKSGKTIKVGLPKLVMTLGQDHDYIYSLISVPVTGYQRVNGDAYADTAVNDIHFIQKISKTTGEQKDDVYLPYSVETYQLNNDSTWNGGDNWSYMAAYYMFMDNAIQRRVQIVDGNIIVAHETTDNNKKVVSAGMIKLSNKKKITPMITDENGKEVEDSSKEKVQLPLVYEDFANVGRINTDTSWTMDHNGNVWALCEGNIRKSAQGNEFQDYYKCESSIDKLEVYDDENLIAWSEDEEIYVTARESEAVLDGGADKVTGWIEDGDGNYRLYNSEGKIVTGWSMNGRGWYYMDDDGIMQTGWLSYEGDWYYLAKSGMMKTGWVNEDSKWYYMNNEGIMQTGWIENSGEWYYTDKSGVMQTGWLKVEDKWYYFNESGVMLKNTTVDGYVLGADGVWTK